MHAETHLALHHARTAELSARAERHALAARAAGPPSGLRTKVGWTLVELGLRLAAAPRPAVAHQPVG